MDEISQKYLNSYLELLKPDVKKLYASFSAGYFCADEVSANTCCELILAGKKSATCSLMYWYEEAGEVMPSVGHLHVLTNWQGDPCCIIENIHVCECKYSDITAEFILLEGEGDGSLVNWQKTHWDFFSKECAGINGLPSEDMILVLERFKVVYIPSMDSGTE